MAFNLQNKKKTDKLNINDYELKTSCDNQCSFYLWSDDNATFDGIKANVIRANVNLSEDNTHNIKLDISDFCCVAKTSEYLVFESKEKSIYLVLALSGAPDLNGDFNLVNNSLKAVDCVFAGKTVEYRIKDTRRTTDYPCILDMWLVAFDQLSDNTLNAVINNICI